MVPPRLPFGVPLRGPARMTPAAPPPTPRRPGILDRLFSVPEQYAGLVTPEDAQLARRDMLMRFGAGLLSQSGWQPAPGTSMGEALGSAMQQMPNWSDVLSSAAERNVGLADARKSQGLDTQRQAILAKYPAQPNETPQQTGARLLRMLPEFVQIGDTETVARLSEVLKSMGFGQGVEQGTPHSGVNPGTNKPQQYLVDRAGNVRWLQDPSGQPVAPVDTRGAGVPQLRAVMGPDGQPTYEEWNPRTGQWTPTNKRAFSPPGDNERRAAFFTSFLGSAESAFNQYTDAPSRWSSLWQDKGLREATSAERQVLDLAGKMYAEAWLRLTTGAAYNEQEFKNAYALFVPQAGDKPQTLRWKAQNRIKLRGALQRATARASFTLPGESPDSTGVAPGTVGSAEAELERLFPTSRP